MIVDIRGTHGSGKSTVVHNLLKVFDHEDWMEKGQPKPLGYLLPEIKGVVLGRYERQCGGCDGISPVAELIRRIELAVAQKHKVIILEGILVSHTHQRYSDLATKYKDIGYNFCFLDTPLKTCIARVRARRRKKGNDKPLDPKNIIKDHRCIWGKVRLKMTNDDHDVHVLPYKDPMPTVIEVMGVDSERLPPWI